MSETTRPPRIAPARRGSHAIASSLILLALPAAAATEWPGFRGPAHGGPALKGALPADQLGLEVAWQKSLGSGYSSIAIKNGRAVTLFTSGADDVLAAFDLASGAEAWRLKLGEKYGGHDGSDDGPNPHRFTSGPTVGSNAPPLRSAHSSAATTAVSVHGLTATGSRPAARLMRLTSLCGFSRSSRSSTESATANPAASARRPAAESGAETVACPCVERRNRRWEISTPGNSSPAS